MQEQTTGIVLRALKYGETKLIVDFLTERYGRMAAAVKIGGGVRGRSRRMLLQQFIQLPAQTLGAGDNDVAGAAGGKLAILELLFDAFQLHVLHALAGAHEGGGADKPRKLVGGIAADAFVGLAFCFRIFRVGTSVP